MDKTPTRLKDYLLFPFKLMIRPFKGFDKIKDNKEISIYFAMFLLLLFSVLSIIEYQYTGFIINTSNPYDLNAITLLITSILPIIIGISANWAITTFIDGKGKFVEIFYTITYSLAPVIIARIINVVASNFITIDDQIFLTVIFIGGVIWSVFLLFIGMVTIHEYSFSMNLLNIILTLIAYAVIVFLILLFFNLIQQLAGFLESLISEIIYRIRGR